MKHKEPQSFGDGEGKSVSVVDKAITYAGKTFQEDK